MLIIKGDHHEVSTYFMSQKVFFSKDIALLAMKNLCIMAILFLFVFIVSCDNKKHVDSNAININNQEDFDQYKNAEFPPGTLILFAAGRSFNGQFAPTGSGTFEKPIKVTAYNPESGDIFWDAIDSKPIINGHGKVNSAFFLYNGQYWEINNIEATNTNGTTDDQGDLRGIHVVAENIGVVNDVKIRNCYVHDVNGNVTGRYRGGIHVHVLGDSIKTKFHNLLIENNNVKKVGGVGIGNQSSWRNIDTEKYYPWTNYVIRGNRIEHTGRNSIIARMGLHNIVEYNVSAYSSRHGTGHSILNFNTVGCIMQYNEAYGNTGTADEIDHGGFDVDYHSRGTIVQYNYSHDNNWFCGIMRQYNRDIKIRYNLSINERLGAYLYGFPWTDKARSIWVYNNTHYFKAGLNASIFVNAGRLRPPAHTAFYNNIFYFEDRGIWGGETDETCEFSNNLFYNIEPRGKNAITKNPMFANPGAAPTAIDMRNREVLNGYSLQSNSPCIDTGIILNDNGGQDFLGNPLGSDNTDIGAFEFK